MLTVEYEMRQGSLGIRVSDRGAELCSLTAWGREWMWQGDPAVWGRHAPTCFPWCGRLKDGWFEQDGRRYENGAHGFARDRVHTLVEQGENRLSFRLDADGDTLARYPWRFRLDTCYTVREDSLHVTYQVENRDSRPMPFQVGFHHAFALPLAAGAATRDHVIRFERAETPEEIVTGPEGLVSGKRPRFTGETEIELTDTLFDQDSICLTSLRSRWVEVALKGGGPALRLGMEGFPYVLLWSKPGPMRFVCIEPWYGLPDRLDGDHNLFRRPAIQVLQPGETFSCTQTTAPLKDGAEG